MRDVFLLRELHLNYRFGRLKPHHQLRLLAKQVEGRIEVRVASRRQSQRAMK
jgi:hypothetical protein